MAGEERGWWRWLPVLVFACSVGVHSTHGSQVPRFSQFDFVVEPSDLVAARDRSALLNCSAYHGETEPSIHWMKDGQELKIEDTNNIHLLTNGSLFFERIESSRSDSEERGAYQCVASVENLGTLVSRTAHVDIAYLSRTFDEEPTDSLVYLDDTAMFGCSVRGLPKPEITWYKNRERLWPGENVLVHSTGVLEIFPVKFQDFASYHCEAANVERTRTSATARLQQNPDVAATMEQGQVPVFAMTPTSQSVLQGSEVTLHCGANGRDHQGKAPSISWLKDGATMDLGARNPGERMSMVGSGSLRLRAVSMADQGTYTCRAKNLEDSVDADATLVVLMPPQFVRRPANHFAHVNSDVTFECQVTGIPRPRVRWMKNGVPVIPSDYFQISDGGSLKILGLVKSDDGMYQCMAHNAAGSVQAAAQLVILEPSSVYADARQLPSAPTQLRAVLVSTRFVTLSWEAPESLGPPKSRLVAYSVFWRERGSERERVLNTTTTEANIQHLKPSTEYEFRVTAYNTVGPSLKHAAITIVTDQEVHVPSPPTDLQVSPRSSSSLLVSWGPPLDPKGTITHYVLIYYLVGSQEQEEVVKETSRLLTDLKKNAVYSVRVVAHNQNGPGTSTEEVEAQTFSDIPSAPPQNFTLEVSSATRIIVRWEPPPPEERNGVIKGYKIRFKKRGHRRGETITTDGNRNIYALTELRKGTEYQVRISALTVNGSGPATPWEYATTYRDDLDESRVPPKPARIKATPKANSILVTWAEPPAEQKILVRGYILGYGKGVPDVFQVTLDANTLDYTIKNLQPASEYVISIRAFNEQGHGEQRFESVTTSEDIEEEPATPMMPPIGLKAIVLSSSTIVLTWADDSLGKSQKITDNRFYTVRYSPHPRNNRRYRFLNSTDLNAHVDGLKPNTEYVFSVMVIKGRRRSTWSMDVFNTTQETAPGSEPKDVTTIVVEEDPLAVTLTWQPPQRPNGLMTGYLIFYTTDVKQEDRHWVVEGVLGDRLSTVISDLTPDTTYYFKVQARNKKGYGPMSKTVVYKTPKAATRLPGDGKAVAGLSMNIIIIIVSCVVGVAFCIGATIIAVIVCRRRDQAARNNRSYKSPGKPLPPYPKQVKPPDLWIHQPSHLELQKLDKGSRSESNLSVATSTLRQPSTQGSSERLDEFPPGMELLDRRRLSYVESGYPSSGEERYQPIQPRSIIRPKPITIPVDAQAAMREPVAMVTALPNGSMSSMEGPGMPVRPVYPRTQYNTQYSNTPRVNAADLPQTCIKPQPTVSPYKKPSAPLSSGPIKPRLSPMATGLSGKQPDVTAKAGKEDKDLKKSQSTEELTAEMANLEGLMKDLNAITQQDFLES